MDEQANGAAASRAICLKISITALMPMFEFSLTRCVVMNGSNTATSMRSRRIAAMTATRNAVLTITPFAFSTASLIASSQPIDEQTAADVLLGQP